MAGAALLFATLIGVFITPDGIVVGADTSLSNRAVQVSTQQKYCVTGPRSVATLQGAYSVQDTGTLESVALYDRFREMCAQMDGSPNPVSLQAQAEYIANGLRSALVAFFKNVSAAEITRRYGSSPVVARIAVSGYEKGIPASVVVGLGVATDVATSRWDVQVRDLSRLTFAACGVRFHGQEVVVEALRRDTDARIPVAERRDAGVMKLSALLRGDCSEASVRTAPAMFAEAARLTAALGIRFGIPAGAVNLPLDIVVIPAVGAIDVTRVDSW